MFRYVLNSDALQADHWKVYPCEVTPFSTIEKWYAEGRYMPYTEVDPTLLVNLLCNVKANVHPWIRLNRVIRDIPEVSIIAGNSNTNLRQQICSSLEKLGESCKCIRCREVRDWPEACENLRVRVRPYRSSGGWEFFITVEGNDRGLGGGAEQRLGKKARKLTKKEKAEVKKGGTLVRPEKDGGARASSAAGGFFQVAKDLFRCGVEAVVGSSGDDQQHTARRTNDGGRGGGSQHPHGSKPRPKAATSRTPAIKKNSANTAPVAVELGVSAVPDSETLFDTPKFQYLGKEYAFHQYHAAEDYLTSKTAARADDETADNGRLYGLLRLRLNDDPAACSGTFPELNYSALIRELHVYGGVKPVYRENRQRGTSDSGSVVGSVVGSVAAEGEDEEPGEDSLNPYDCKAAEEVLPRTSSGAGREEQEQASSGRWREPRSYYERKKFILPPATSETPSSNEDRPQHGGIGKLLMYVAERIALAHNWPKISVIAGVGVRNYYRNLGYEQRGEGRYLLKNLKDLDLLFDGHLRKMSLCSTAEVVPPAEVVSESGGICDGVAAVNSKCAPRYPFEMRSSASYVMPPELTPLRGRLPVRHFEVRYVDWQREGPKALDNAGGALVGNNLLQNTVSSVTKTVSGVLDRLGNRVVGRAWGKNWGNRGRRRADVGSSVGRDEIELETGAGKRLLLMAGGAALAGIVAVKMMRR